MRPPSLAPLRLPAYRRLFSAYLVNNLGDWVGEIALSVLVYRATDSVLAVTALWVLGRFVPGLLAPFSVSAIERRFGATRPLPGLHLLEAALFASLAAAAATGAPVSSEFLALALVDGTVSSSARALVKTAIVATTQPQGLLREGNALLGVSFTATVALGPVVGGAVVALLGVPAALILDAASFAFAASALNRGLPGVACRRRGRDDLFGAGFAHLWRERELRVLVLAEGAAGVFLAAIVPVELVFVTETLGGTEADFGLVLAAWGAGAVIGSALVSALPRTGTRTLLATAVALMIAGYLGMGTAAHRRRRRRVVVRRRHRQRRRGRRARHLHPGADARRAPGPDQRRHRGAPHRRARPRLPARRSGCRRGVPARRLLGRRPSARWRSPLTAAAALRRPSPCATPVYA